MTSKFDEVKVVDFINVTDYVANGSFSSLKENVTYKNEESYAILVRLTDYNANWQGTKVYVDKKSYNFLKKSTVYSEDVIISNVGANAGTVFRAPNIDKPMTLGPNSVLLKPKSDFPFVKDYIYYFFTSSHGQHLLRSILSGSAQPKFNKTDLRNLLISIPSNHNYKLIVKPLLDLDRKIELNQQINQTLESIAQALFKSWFVDFDPVKAKIAAKAEGADAAGITLAAMEAISGQNAEALAKMAGTEPERYAELKATAELFPDVLVDSELGEIPEGWEVKNIKSLTTKLSKGTTPSKKVISQAQDSESILFIKVKDLTNNGEILDANLTQIPKSVHISALKRSILQENDILYSIAGTIGRCALVDKNFHNANTNQALAFIRLKSLDHLHLVHESLKSNRIKNQVISSIVQGVQANVSLTTLGELEVILPDDKLINAWNSTILPIKNKLQLYIHQNKTLAQIKDSLLPKLLSGEVSVEDV